MTRYSIEQRTQKYVKGYGFLSSMRNPPNIHRKKLLDTAKKRTKCSKKVVDKAAEATRQTIGDKTMIKL